MLEQGLKDLGTGAAIPGSYFRYKGDDIGFAGAIGVRWQPHEQHAFGLNYQTGSSFDLNGKTEGTDYLSNDSSAQMDFMTPDRVAVGYSYRPKPGWNIEANIEWLNWDELNTLTVKTSSVPQTDTMPVTFDWKSSFIYEIGASYTTENGYIFAIGYDYNESSQPDRNFTPGVCDADLQWLNLGFGRKYGDSQWMLTYQFGYSNRKVDSATEELANGRYQSRHNALVLAWQQGF
jgi:long-chain fatty acid transport protein